MGTQKNHGYKIAVVGATGAVGRELFEILEDRKFPVAELRPFASARSEGRILHLNEKPYRCTAMTKGCFDGIDIAFFDASDEVSEEWALHAAEAGAWVIDNSATYRLDPEVSLVVPEVNGKELSGLSNSTPKGKARIIAGPNCTTVQLVVALKPIHEKWGIKRIVVSTYQSTSGAGTAAMDELSAQTAAMFNQKSLPAKVFSHQIAFNCIPQIGGFKDDGYTSEEQKVVNETRKIMGLPKLKVSVTAVRVPTFSCHGESVNIECEKPFSVEEVRAALGAQDGVILLDDPSKQIYPMNVTGEGDPVEGATGNDAVYVGRIRKDTSVENGLNLWVVSDNLRKGAALNAVQIAETLIKILN
ncbi:MAG: aspartate-semialdehyde dehydrogenase [Methylotenera sp.]|nr:aspartate-semialdehyde dehydrogenase [Oligoflexia bacterium]